MPSSCKKTKTEQIKTGLPSTAPEDATAGPFSEADRGQCGESHQKRARLGFAGLSGGVGALGVTDNRLSPETADV